MFLTNQWYVAATSNELDRDLLARRIADVPIVLWRAPDQQPVAFADRCPHRLAPLSRGKLVDGVLECGYHGIRYDVSGACVSVPGQSVPKNAGVRAYPVKEQWGYIWLWLGEPGRADASLIPDFHWMTEPGWAVNNGYMHINANYQLVIDNLMDLSHVAFLHPNTIGTAAVGETPPEVNTEGNQVRVTRWTRDCEPPPTFKRAGGFTGNIDRLQDSLYAPPCYVNVEVRAMSAGSNAQSAGIEMRVLHAVVPETATTSHDFWAQSRHFSVDDAEIGETLRASTVRTLEEDKAMIEAQQAVLREAPLDSRTLFTRGDAGAAHVRHVITKLMKEEARGAL